MLNKSGSGSWTKADRGHCNMQPLNSLTLRGGEGAGDNSVRQAGYAEVGCCRLGRNELLAKETMMEEQLQVTAGELSEAERRIAQLSASKQSEARAEDPVSSHVVLAGGHLVSVNSIRRDYGAVMQVSLPLQNLSLTNQVHEMQRVQ